MKNKILIIALLGCGILQAQDFKPYKIESGKIEYEKLKYSMHAGIKFENGVETGFREMIPYVSEEVIYYWDDFGNRAFEETYKVSTFGGEALPEKIKSSEKFWLGDILYDFFAEPNLMYEKSHYIRKECFENFQYYQIKDSWIETFYMGAEKMGTEELLGEEADYYKIDEGEDLFAWKGLVLKNETFATSGGSGKRSDIVRTTVAVKIDTLTEIDEHLLNEPNWLKRGKMYSNLDGFKIVELLDAKPNLFTQADNKKGIEIQKNDIFFFVTSNLNIGKMQILGMNEDNTLNIKFDLYSANNSIESHRDLFSIENNSFLEIDQVAIETKKSKEVDFLWGHSKTSILFPQNNIGLYLLNSSRTNDFQLLNQ